MHRTSKLTLILTSAILLLLNVPIDAQEPKSLQPWPKLHIPSQAAKVVVYQKGNQERPFIYHTRHFEFHSPQSISTHHLKKFATIAESVPQAMDKIPLPLLGMDKDNRSKILIYPDEDSFIKAGGAPGAAGYYTGKQRAVMLRGDSFLNAPRAAGSKLPPRPDYDLLVHELTHLCMHNSLGYLPRWFSEGVAEYMAAAHESNGVYRFDRINSGISRHIKSHRSRDTDNVKLLSVKTTMALTMETWRQRIGNNNPEAFYQMYGTSLLLVHTLFHGGDERRQKTYDFLTNIRDEEALDIKVNQLIKQADHPNLQKRITTFWRPKGLRLEFTD